MKPLMLFLAFFLLPASTIHGVMPPHRMAERTLQAELIVIGRVVQMGKILLPEGRTGFSPQRDLAFLEVLHVVKGAGKAEKGNRIQVIWLPFKESSSIRRGRTPSRP